jgi:HEAT repeat protein
MRPRTVVLLAGLLIPLPLAGCGKKPRPAEPEATADAGVNDPAPPAPRGPSPLPAPPRPGSPEPDDESASRPAPSAAAEPGPSPPAEPAPAVLPFPADLGGLARAGSPAPPAPQPPPVAPLSPTPVPQPPADPPGDSRPPARQVAHPPVRPAPPAPEPPQPKEPEWPKEIGGKDVAGYVKDFSDPDPAVREQAVRTLPNFGPAARKGTGKALLRLMERERERDPGVRVAAYVTAAALGFEDEADIKEAIRLLGLAADEGVSGGPTRLNAIQTLAAFGPKAEGAVNYVAGRALSDSSYETRRSIAFTLGRIGFNEQTGPSPKALAALTGTLIKDTCAIVRMEAMQSLVLLGPPWLPRPPGAPPAKDVKDPKDAPKPDEKAAAAHVAAVKARLGLAGGKPLEHDRQVEIWGRLVLMRFDPKEVNDANLAAIARHISGPDVGAKLQAINALGLLGEAGAKKIDDVVRALADPDPLVVETAVAALVKMGPAARGAIPDLEKLKARGTRKEEKEFYQNLADAAIKMISGARSPGPAGTAPGMPEARK